MGNSPHTLAYCNVPRIPFAVPYRHTVDAHGCHGIYNLCLCPCQTGSPSIMQSYTFYRICEFIQTLLQHDPQVSAPATIVIIPPILFPQPVLRVSFVVSRCKSPRLSLPGERSPTARSNKYLFSASGWEWNLSMSPATTFIEIPVPSSSIGVHTFLTDLLNKVFCFCCAVGGLRMQVQHMTVQRSSRKPRGEGGLRCQSTCREKALYALGLESWKYLDERRILQSALVSALTSKLTSRMHTILTAIPRRQHNMTCPWYPRYFSFPFLSTNSRTNSQNVSLNWAKRPTSWITLSSQ